MITSTVPPTNCPAAFLEQFFSFSSSYKGFSIFSGVGSIAEDTFGEGATEEVARGFLEGWTLARNVWGCEWKLVRENKGLSRKKLWLDLKWTTCCRSKNYERLSTTWWARGDEYETRSRLSVDSSRRTNRHAVTHSFASWGLPQRNVYVLSVKSSDNNAISGTSGSLRLHERLTQQDMKKKELDSVTFNSKGGWVRRGDIRSCA